MCGLDLRDAFTSVRRDVVIAECNSADPRLGAVAEAWLLHDTEHIIVADGAAETVTQRVGLDQGCPMSPGLFAVATTKALQHVRQAMLVRDDQAAVVAFLDDTYLIGLPDAVAAGCAAFGLAKGAIGLRVNQDKTKVWCPPRPAQPPPSGGAASPRIADSAGEGEAAAGAPAPSPPRNADSAGAGRGVSGADQPGRRPLPATLARYEVASLRCMGATVTYARRDRIEEDEEWRDVSVGLHGGEADCAEWLTRQQRFYQRILELHENDLPLAHALALVRTWSPGAPVHLQRAHPLPLAWAQQVDESTVDVVARLLRQPFDITQKQQLFMRIAEGGLGMGSAEARAEAVWIGAWGTGIAHTPPQLRDCLA